MNEVISKPDGSVFDGIKQVNDHGMEYWSARDLQKALGYVRWEKFLNVIKKAKIACEQSGHLVDDHFPHVGKKVLIGSNTYRDVDDYLLSRYACYLVIQNSDPSKEIVALGQTYFAVQTRRQEIMDSEAYSKIGLEDDKRLYLRNEMKEHNKLLADAANNAGVTEPYDYGVFQNHGYMGLYGGMTRSDIHKNKELKKSQQILDHMGSTELAANLFRATQTEEKLRREEINNKEKANQTHLEVGKKVRETIKDLGGTMPEDLPTPDSLQRFEKKKKKQIERGR